MDAMVILAAALAAMNVKEIVSLAAAMDSACGEGTASAFGGAIVGASALKVAEVATPSRDSYEWGVVLTFPATVGKIQLIKAVRQVTHCGLRAAKEAVDDMFIVWFGDAHADVASRAYKVGASTQFTVNCDSNLPYDTMRDAARIVHEFPGDIQAEVVAVPFMVPSEKGTVILGEYLN